MSPTRRHFLKLLTLAGGALACNAPALHPSTEGPASAPAPLDSPSPAPAATPSTPPTPVPSPTATPILPRPLFIVDGHQDITWNWLEFGRDPRQSALEGREEEDGGLVEKAMGDRTTGLPEYLAGRVGIIFGSIFVMPANVAYYDFQSQTYADNQVAHAKGIEQIEAYHRLAASEPRFSLITDRQALDAVEASWQTDDPQAHKVGIVIAMEGADPIRKPAELDDWYERGLRSIMPAWHRTLYAGASSDALGLTDFGRELLAEMAKRNMILDLSHLSYNGSLLALDAYPGPIIASHSNPRTIANSHRAISDEMIRGVGEHDGVIGIMLYNRFLDSTWTYDTEPGLVTLETVVDAIDAVAQLTGSVAHVGIGSDFDGGFGSEAIPLGMNTVADLLMLSDALAAKGYITDDIEAIMNGNWLRVLRRSLPSSV